ncbi:hypothetical protein [Comamonas sp. CMM02]|uniref:hypothetical protein n=1 Tax=Comamonas sp. CMM02 TaxID=2769307 RepID=UPI00177BAE0E|nr:hypothetical protein [Comamonas sp. CMM02]MBD9401001.1 hypothetical protein [Comamonas sp. CMM02]
MNDIKNSDVKSIAPNDVRSLLQFFAKRHPGRSQKSLAELADLDPGNIQASLNGRRALAPESVPLIAASLGLKYKSTDADGGHLALEQDCVAQVEVPIEELGLLDAAVRCITSGPPRWILISKLWAQGVVEDGTDESVPGVYTLLIGRISESYLIVHLRWPSLRDAIEQSDICVKLSKMLYGSWDRDQGLGMSVSSAHWIRLAAGVVGTRSLDKLFGDEVRPTLSEWANLLLALEAKGATPQSVLAGLGG